MTFFIVTLFRSFDEKSEIDNEGDDKNELNTYDRSKIDQVLLMRNLKVFSLIICFICYTDNLINKGILRIPRQAIE